METCGTSCLKTTGFEMLQLQETICWSSIAVFSRHHTAILKDPDISYILQLNEMVSLHIFLANFPYREEVIKELTW